MAVHSQILPPTSACENPHSLLKSESSVLRVLSEAELWPTNSYLRAGVSGLGFGGINAGLLYGTTVTATVQSGNSFTSLSGRLGGPTGRGYAVNDGFGLIDAFAAYLKLTGGAASGQ